MGLGSGDDSDQGKTVRQFPQPSKKVQNCSPAYYTDKQVGHSDNTDKYVFYDRGRDYTVELLRKV